jgi:hypothetical protein
MREKRERDAFPHKKEKTNQIMLEQSLSPFASLVSLFFLSRF